MQSKIDKRQLIIDRNEDKIANILINSPRSSGVPTKTTEDHAAANEEELRQKDMLIPDTVSEAETEKHRDDAS